MSFKVSELHGQAFYRRGEAASAWKGPGYEGPGWWFESNHGLTAGLEFGPFATPDAALEHGPPLAACYGVELATAIDESRTEAE